MIFVAACFNGKVKAAHDSCHLYVVKLLDIRSLHSITQELGH